MTSTWRSGSSAGWRTTTPGFHDHDLSHGAVAVVRGARPRGPARTSTARAAGARSAPGRRSRFGASDIHRVLHAGRAPAVTLHAYSPPLWRMGAYEVRGDGTLARHSLSYAEELRPLEAAGQHRALASPPMADRGRGHPAHRRGHRLGHRRRDAARRGLRRLGPARRARARRALPPPARHEGLPARRGGRAPACSCTPRAGGPSTTSSC